MLVGGGVAVSVHRFRGWYPHYLVPGGGPQRGVPPTLPSPPHRLRPKSTIQTRISSDSGARYGAMRQGRGAGSALTCTYAGIAGICDLTPSQARNLRGHHYTK